MKKTRFLVLYFLFFISLVGCEEEEPRWNQDLSCGFITSEMLVEVTAETQSFRIEVEWPSEHPDPLYVFNMRPQIYIDEDATTAKHKTHFVNTYGYNSNTIGSFWVLEGARKAYRDVTIMPEKITEEVVIIYNAGHWNWNEGTPIEVYGGLFRRLTVILKPKS